MDRVCYRCGRVCSRESVERTGLGLTITKRQMQVWKCLSEGMTLKASASLLRVSVKAIEYHRYELQRRLGVHEIASLTKLAILRGVTPATL